MIRRATRIRKLLEEDGGSCNSGLSAPVKYLLGSHEYKWPNDWDMSNILGSFGYHSFRESLSYIDINNIRILFLNTSYNITNDNKSNTDQTIPTDKGGFNAIEWIREKVYDHNGPIVAFGHHPLDYGEGTDPYDSVNNQHEVAKVLSRHGQCTYIHGHTHHGWGYSKLHSGPWGVNNIFINETEDRNFAKLTLNASGWRVQLSKRFRHKGPLGGTFGGTKNYLDKQRKVKGFSISENIRHKSLSRININAGCGSEVRMESNGLCLESDSTNDAASASLSALKSSPGNDGYGWQERRALWRVSIQSCNKKARIVQGKIGDNHIGFEISNNKFFGIVGNKKKKHVQNYLMPLIHKELSL